MKKGTFCFFGQFVFSPPSLSKKQNVPFFLQLDSQCQSPAEAAR